MARPRWSLIVKLKVSTPKNRSLLVRLPIHIPPKYKAIGAPQPPMPDELKQTILEKHQQWLEANQMGRAATADPVGKDLDELEGRAKLISMENFET